MTSSLSDLAPTAIAIIFAACLLWVLWRLIRALSRPSPVRYEPHLHMQPEPTRREPRLVVQDATTQPVAPESADVLALKASIDNLARQIAILERRLASMEMMENVPAIERLAEPAPILAEPTIRITEGRT